MSHPLSESVRTFFPKDGPWVGDLGERVADALDAYHEAESRAESPEWEQKVRDDLLQCARELRRAEDDLGAGFCETAEAHIGMLRRLLTDARANEENAKQETVNVRRGFRCSNEKCTTCHEDPVFPARTGISEVDDLLDMWQVSADGSGEIEGIGFARIWTWCAQNLAKSTLIDILKDARAAAVPEGCEVVECEVCGGDGSGIVGWDDYDQHVEAGACSVCDGTGWRVRKKEAPDAVAP